MTFRVQEKLHSFLDQSATPNGLTIFKMTEIILLSVAIDLKGGIIYNPEQDYGNKGENHRNRESFRKQILC